MPDKDVPEIKETPTPVEPKESSQQSLSNEAMDLLKAAAVGGVVGAIAGAQQAGKIIDGATRGVDKDAAADLVDIAIGMAVPAIVVGEQVYKQGKEKIEKAVDTVIEFGKSFIPITDPWESLLKK